MPHRLYGHVDAAENYSVGRWCEDAARGARGGRSGRARADPGRRHRALFQGADPGACGGAADRRPRSAPRCGPAATPKARAALHAELARARSGDGAAAQARRPHAHRARPGGDGGDRAIAGGLAPRRHAGDPRPGAGAEDISRRRPRRVVPPDRRPLRRHAGGRRAGRGEGACRPRARSDAAGDEGARGAVAAGGISPAR